VGVGSQSFAAGSSGTIIFTDTVIADGWTHLADDFTSGSTGTYMFGYELCAGGTGGSPTITAHITVDGTKASGTEVANVAITTTPNCTSFGKSGLVVVNSGQVVRVFVSVGGTGTAQFEPESSLSLNKISSLTS
jgi:hypothetical protein